LTRPQASRDNNYRSRSPLFAGGGYAHGWGSFDPSDFEGSFKKKVLDAEQALMLAVLRNAVEDFQEYVHARDAIQKKLFQEAEEWILEKNTDWFFSFENICESLQLEPGYIRQGLLSWKEAKRCHINRAA
jgi:hypothetical protein